MVSARGGRGYFLRGRFDLIVISFVGGKNVRFGCAQRQNRLRSGQLVHPILGSTTETRRRPENVVVPVLAGTARSEEVQTLPRVFAQRFQLHLPRLRKTSRCPATTRRSATTTSSVRLFQDQASTINRRLFIAIECSKMSTMRIETETECE